MITAFSIFLAMFLVPPIAVGLMGYCYVNDIDVETGIFWLLAGMSVIGACGLIGLGFWSLVLVLL